MSIPIQVFIIKIIRWVHFFCSAKSCAGCDDPQRSFFYHFFFLNFTQCHN